MEDDGDDKEESKRLTRNLSEKKRRDQFNSLVTELSNLISNNNRKMDKSTVLRSTISFLKNHNEVTVRSRAHDVQEDWKPAFLSNEEFTYLVLEALEGFVMVFSTSGRIYYASESITSLLGHDPTEIVDKNIFDMMYADDQQKIYNILQRNAATEHIENQAKENEMIRFQVHVRRGCLDFREEVSYDVVQFFGHFRTNQEQDIERDVMDFQDVDLSSRTLFVCIGCLRTPKLIRDVSLVDSTRSEFTSRHSLEWKFLFLDHRAPPIIGYLPFEVLGTSGYDYYHFDDLEKVVTCHEALMQKGELTSGYYRFLTKGQQWIWLQTRFYITYHQWNSKPEFVVCTHRVVSYADVLKTKEELVEQDTELSESDHVESLKEMPVKDPLPKLSPPYNMSEENTDAYVNAYQSTSQIKLKKKSCNLSPPSLLKLKKHTSQNPSFELDCNMIEKPTAPVRKDTQACAFCEYQKLAKKSAEALVAKPLFTQPLVHMPQSFIPKPLAPQVPTTLELHPTQPRPERTIKYQKLDKNSAEPLEPQVPTTLELHPNQPRPEQTSKYQKLAEKSAEPLLPQPLFTQPLVHMPQSFVPPPLATQVPTTLELHPTQPRPERTIKYQKLDKNSAEPLEPQVPTTLELHPNQPRPEQTSKYQKLAEKSAEPLLPQPLFTQPLVHMPQSFVPPPLATQVPTTLELHPTQPRPERTCKYQKLAKKSAEPLAPQVPITLELHPTQPRPERTSKYQKLAKKSAEPRAPQVSITFELHPNQPRPERTSKYQKLAEKSAEPLAPQVPTTLELHPTQPRPERTSKYQKLAQKSAEPLVPQPLVHMPQSFVTQPLAPQVPTTLELHPTQPRPEQTSNYHKLAKKSAEPRAPQVSIIFELHPTQPRPERTSKYQKLAEKSAEPLAPQVPTTLELHPTQPRPERTSKYQNLAQKSAEPLVPQPLVHMPQSFVPQPLAPQVPTTLELHPTQPRPERTSNYQKLAQKSAEPLVPQPLVHMHESFVPQPLAPQVPSTLELHPTQPRPERTSKYQKLAKKSAEPLVPQPLFTQPLVHMPQSFVPQPIAPQMPITLELHPTQPRPERTCKYQKLAKKSAEPLAPQVPTTLDLDPTQPRPERTSKYQKLAQKSAEPVVPQPPVHMPQSFFPQPLAPQVPITLELHPTQPRPERTSKYQKLAKKSAELLVPQPLVHMPQSFVPQPLAPQVPTTLELHLTQPRPERSMSSLSALLDGCPSRFDPPLQPASVKIASASRKCGTIAQAAVPTGDNWNHAQAQYNGRSDTSGEARNSQRNSDREVCVAPHTQPQPQHTKQDSLIAPQHDVGAHYVDPMYVTGAVTPGLLTLSASPPLQDQTQIQEQLHRKHEELQQMIVRQQEELRQVKEQLLLARLGILQPFINVPSNSYPTQGELQNQEPTYSAHGQISQPALPSIPPQPPQQPHPDHRHMPQ